MIKTKRGLLLVALLTLAVTLILTIPARVAYRWVAPSGIVVNGIEGTVWRGRADALSAQGVYVSDVSWQINPLRLLLAQASYQVKGSPVSGFVEATVGLGLGGTMSVSDFNASLPLYLFAESFNVTGLQGDASLQFEHIEMRDGLPVAAEGSVRVSNVIAPRLSRESIGGYQAEFFSQDGGITATVEDTDGVVDLAGSLQVKDDRSYQFLGKVMAKPAAPESLTRQLEYLGSADERGRRELRLEGML